MKRADRTNTTPGPKINPLCARNVLEAKQKKNKILSIERKLSLKECTWQFSAHGGQRKYNKSTTCCSGKDCYRKFRKAAPNDAEWAHLVSNYRKYYHSLNNDKKRQWYDEHAIFKGYKKVAEGQTLKKNHQLYDLRCENYETMHTRITHATPEDTLRPVPDESCWVEGGVCSRFIEWLVAGHHDTKDQYAIRKAAFAGKKPAEPEDFDCSIPSQRSPNEKKDNDKQYKQGIAMAWLEEQGSLALTNPGEDFCVLPYRSCLDTHAHFIMERELCMGKPWARGVLEESLNPSPREEPANESEANERLEEEVDEAMDEVHHLHHPWNGHDSDAEEEQERKAVQQRKKYRYGNRLCGLKTSERPEDPSLCTLSYFNKIWRVDTKLARIICREHIPFAKCDFCIRHRNKKERKRTVEVVQKDMEELRLHLEMIKAEKLTYYGNRARARLWPHRFLSIIIDGADQSKHDMPHFKDQSHLSSEAKKIKMHLYGGLVHGRGAYAFTMPDHEPQGHNTTIQCLHAILCHILLTSLIPPILKLQLDNTTKQNKGQYLFGYLALLVEYGIFEYVEVSFLPVGHTHEDIDQFFSRISVWLR